jgi:hypothetical protein
LQGNFGNCAQWRSLNLFGFTGDATSSNREKWSLSSCILITTENYSDSDSSSESEFDGASEPLAESDDDESQDLEPDLSEDYEEYRNTLRNPEAQIQAQLDDAELAQLHAKIKA